MRSQRGYDHLLLHRQVTGVSEGSVRSRLTKQRELDTSVKREAKDKKDREKPALPRGWRGYLPCVHLHFKITEERASVASDPEMAT